MKGSTKTPLPKVEARRVVGTYVSWCVEPETGDIGEAFRIEDEAGISALLSHSAWWSLPNRSSRSGEKARSADPFCDTRQ